MINWLVCNYKPGSAKIKFRGKFSPMLALAAMQLLVKSIERDSTICMDGVKAELEKITKNKIELGDKLRDE